MDQLSSIPINTPVEVWKDVTNTEFDYEGVIVGGFWKVSGTVDLYTDKLDLAYSGKYYKIQMEDGIVNVNVLRVTKKNE